MVRKSLLHALPTALECEGEPFDNHDEKARGQLGRSALVLPFRVPWH
jgi:hypothetical protein